MQIWVDADACPQAIKEILFRAAERAQVVMTLVANTLLRTPSSPFIRAIRVPKGFDGADHRIVKEMASGDLVITADIPLAAEVIERGGHALDPRGELYSVDNVRERLAIRNLLQGAHRRSGAVHPEQPSPVRESPQPLPDQTAAGRLRTPSGAQIDDGDDWTAAVRSLVHRIDRDEDGWISDRRRRHAADRRLGVAMMVDVGVVEHDLASAA